MTISLVIPYYQCDDQKPGVLASAVHSMAGHFTELIVIADKIDNLAVKINKGLKMATCDYIVCTNDDVVLQTGGLEGLCKPGEVVTPMINGGSTKIFHGHAWGMPRSVYEQIGGMDEDYQLYWMDVDYAARLKKAGIPVSQTREVDMMHPEPARTLASYVGKKVNNDESVFVRKWGRTYYDPIKEL
jgi:glycosyltransferase involved in cell wall biosynthesis